MCQLEEKETEIAILEHSTAAVVTANSKCQIRLLYVIYNLYLICF